MQGLIAYLTMRAATDIPDAIIRRSIHTGSTYEQGRRVAAVRLSLILLSPLIAAGIGVHDRRKQANKERIAKERSFEVILNTYR